MESFHHNFFTFEVIDLSSCIKYLGKQSEAIATMDKCSTSCH